MIYNTRFGLWFVCKKAAGPALSWYLLEAPGILYILSDRSYLQFHLAKYRNNLQALDDTNEILNYKNLISPRISLFLWENSKRNKFSDSGVPPPSVAFRQREKSAFRDHAKSSGLSSGVAQASAASPSNLDGARPGRESKRYQKNVLRGARGTPTFFGRHSE